MIVNLLMFQMDFQFTEEILYKIFFLNRGKNCLYILIKNTYHLLEIYNL